MISDRVSNSAHFATGRTFAAEKSAVAHDLCNHLQVIASTLHWIERSIDGSASSDLTFHFMGARSALQRAARLSRAIVDSGSKTAPAPERVSLVDRFNHICEAAALTAGPGIRIERRLEDDVPDVFCDAERLDNAILNIVINARRAMSGAGWIRISAARVSMGPDALPFAMLCIADTGCGMAPDIAARVFEPRFTTRPVGEGSGIGLAMVADFARDAGGSVAIDSRLGVGTVVTIRLPGVLKTVRCRVESDCA